MSIENISSSFVTYLLPPICGGNFGTVSKTITKVESKHRHVDRVHLCEAYVYGERGPSRTFDTSCWPRVIKSSARL